MRMKLLFSLLIISVLSVLLISCNRTEFDGTRVANPDSYRLDIEQMNGTDTHALELNAEDTLTIHFETEHGKLHMEIKSPDGTLIYTGNGEEATDFTVNIAGNGEYFICVEAKDARGKIYIQRKAI